MRAQRLRFRYRLTEEASSLGSRDIVAAWADALSTAGFVVARSSGKRPGPLVSVAAPLPHGATSDWELIDIHLERSADPQTVLCRVGQCLPAGLLPVSVKEIGPSAPSLQSQLRWAEYEVETPTGGKTREDVLAAIIRLLESDHVPAEHRREKKVKKYDLRPLVLDVRLEGQGDDAFRLWMRLRAEPEQSARADQTVLALGLPEPTRVHRVRLFVEETPAVLLAYRTALEAEGG